MVALDASVAEDAAWIRGRSGMALPDAIVVASARAADATVLVTNDRGIAAQPRLDVVYVDDLVDVRPGGV
jgi:predicted nucleic acid-binding protein